MSVIYLDIFDPHAYYVLEKALEIQEKWSEDFEVIPIFNGSILSYLPLLAFAWMKRDNSGDDLCILLTLLKAASGPSEYWLCRVLGSIKAYSADEDPFLVEKLLCIDNVRFLADMLARSELLEIKALTMTQPDGRVFIGYGEIQDCLNQFEGEAWTK